ncbi:MAG TPA: glycosyltransferase family 2 protein [Vicinamibacterales bacterium]|nr:glycosyltransferase family 2 protein [Vicinamibacterales bacterium]
MAELTIVIPSYQARPHLVACLESLVAAPPRVPHEVVVVDSASTDGSAAAVRARFPEVQVVELAANRGFAAAVNAGIRATDAGGARLVLLLNSDTLVPPGAVDRLVARYEALAGVGVAGPRLVDARGRPELSFGPMPGPAAELWQKLLGRAYERGRRWAAGYVERRTRREHFPAWVSGACLLVERAEAHAVGLFDERYALYLEDADFCAAVRARGRRVLFTPAAEIVHLRGRSRAQAGAAADAAYRRSQLAFYAKHHPVWLPVLRAYLRARGEPAG